MSNEARVLPRVLITGSRTAGSVDWGRALAQHLKDQGIKASVEVTMEYQDLDKIIFEEEVEVGWFNVPKVMILLSAARFYDDQTGAGNTFPVEVGNSIYEQIERQSTDLGAEFIFNASQDPDISTLNAIAQTLMYHQGPNIVGK